MSQHDSGSWKHEVTIPSDTTVGSELVQRLLEAMEHHGWAQDQMFRVQLAYEEAIVNAIRHGNQFSDDKTVDVKMHCDANQIVIEIEDMGAGFDPDNLPDPRDEDRLEIPGGRGVMLIQELMTEVNYNDKGNCVRMRKSKAEQAEGAE